MNVRSQNSDGVGDFSVPRSGQYPKRETDSVFSPEWTDIFQPRDNGEQKIHE